MKTEIINVTPQLASDWLKRNTDNRPLRRTVVQNFKSAIDRGEYIPTHQGIAFSDTGVLLDGQHRLTAISELNHGSFPMVVTWGVSDDAFKVMDIGIKRTASDALKQDKRIVEVARLAAAICIGSKGGLSPTMLIPYIELITPFHNSLTAYCGSVTRTWSSAPIRLCAIVSMMTGADHDYVKQVYRSLVLSDFESMPRVAQSLYRAQVNGSVRISGGLDTVSRGLKVFDYSKSTITKVQITDTTFAANVIRSAFQNIYQPPIRFSEKKTALTSAAKDISLRNFNPIRP